MSKKKYNIKSKFIKKVAFNNWDYISLFIYLLLTITVTYIGLNNDFNKKDVISLYTFGTPLFLYIFNYKSLRNISVFAIWFLFSLFHLWLYYQLIEIEGFKQINGHAVSRLNLTWIFMIYFQIVRFLHLKIEKTELVSPGYGANYDLFDNRKIKFWDYIFFFVFFIIWSIVLPTTY